MVCPIISNTATNDTAVRGSTYRKSYGLNNAIACAALTPPLTWVLDFNPKDNGGNPATLDKPTMPCVSNGVLQQGTLTWQLRVNEPLGDVNWTITLTDSSSPPCVSIASWKTTIVCPTINNQATDDTVVAGTTYTRDFGLVDAGLCHALIDPLTWTLTAGAPGATIGDPSIVCAVPGGIAGVLLYDVPKKTVGGTVLNWTISLADSNVPPCQYSFSWKTTVSPIPCLTITNPYSNDTIAAGTEYRKPYSLPNDACVNLIEPITWVLNGPLGASLNDPSNLCIGGGGTLIYLVPVGTSVGTIYNWTITITDSNEPPCSQSWSWKTTVTPSPECTWALVVR